MEPIEVPEQTGINDLAPRYPLSRLRTVTLPIHEVLETPPTTSGVHDTANGVDRTPVDHPRGRRTGRRGQQGTEENRLQAGDVEGRMDSEGLGQFQTDHSWVNDPLHHKRTSKPGGQFL